MNSQKLDYLSLKFTTAIMVYLGLGSPTYVKVTLQFGSTENNSKNLYVYLNSSNILNQEIEILVHLTAKMFFELAPHR